MSRRPPPSSDRKELDSRSPGFEEAPARGWSEDDAAETVAALEEYRRTGVSHSIDESMAELDRLIADRKVRRT